MLKIFLYLAGRNKAQRTFVAPVLKTVGSGLNVQERKCLETTGIMAKHCINSETGF